MSDPLSPPLQSGSDHVIGAEDAPLQLVMYGDFQCPYCVASQSIIARVLARLDGRVRFAFRHYPLGSVHPDAQLAAEASEAAAARGKFWEMHQKLYALRGDLSLARMIEAATAVGLDPHEFRSELESHRWADVVAEQFAGGTASGVAGTPTFFVNGRRHDGAFDAQSLLAALQG